MPSCQSLSVSPTVPESLGILHQLSWLGISPLLMVETLHTFLIYPLTRFRNRISLTRVEFRGDLRSWLIMTRGDARRQVAGLRCTGHSEFVPQRIEPMAQL